MYADEFSGLLARVRDERIDIDLRLVNAFSRDTAQKVYVQHRMAENSADIWSLLKEGSLYVCGDAKRMAHDVNQTLEQIAITHGSMDEENAKEWTKSLRIQNRYQEDVWS